MNRPTASKAENIFLAASELDRLDRPAFIEAQCEGDKALIAEVNALLQAAEASEEYFGRLPERLGVDRLRSTARHNVYRAKAGQQFGQYCLVSKLSAGGTGEVWRAERSDGRFEGEVAIKLLTRLGGTSVLKQFDSEANYLAKLTHSNIARLIDAGIGPDEIPYLILDYVDGDPIDQHCNTKALTIDRRLDLFAQVLDAVAHAHSHLIVHSDIKPSNVLVTRDGSVKLLDFGISTLLSAVDSTGYGTGLTPEYAAPEQLAGAGITTATDIYSLGLLLYVLLAGSSPRNSAEITSLKELQQVALQDPPPLSTTLSALSERDEELLKARAAERSASPRALVRVLRGELDYIVRKALAIDPQDRYRSATQLAADLRRYRCNEPIVAHPDSMTYRTRKFVQRHRGSVLTGSLTLAALVAAAFVATWQGIEASRQRDIAIRGQEHALATNRLLNKLLSEVSPDGERVSLQQLLDRGVSIVDQEYGISERSTAMTLYDLSILYGRLGQVDTQINLLDRAESIGKNLNDSAVIASALCAKARLKREANSVASQADLTAGLTALATLPRRESVRLVECHRAKALSLSAAGDHDGAIGVYQAAVNALDTADVPSIGWRMTLLNDLAEQYYLTERFPEVLPILDEIIAENVRLGRDRSVNQIIMLANRGAVLLRLGEVLRGSESQRQALELAQGMERAPVGIAQHYAGSLLRLGQYEQALELFREDYSTAESAGNKRWQGQIAMQLASVLLNLDSLGEAEANLVLAEQIFAESPAIHVRQILTSNLTRVELMLARGDIAGARQRMADILEGLDYPQSKDRPGLSSALWTAANIALAAGDASSALIYASDELAIAIATARDPAASANVGQALHQKARALQMLGDREFATVEARRSIVALSAGFGSDHSESLEVQSLLDELERQQ